MYKKCPICNNRMYRKYIGDDLYYFCHYGRSLFSIIKSGSKKGELYIRKGRGE